MRSIVSNRRAVVRSRFGAALCRSRLVKRGHIVLFKWENYESEHRHSRQARSSERVQWACAGRLKMSLGPTLVNMDDRSTTDEGARMRNLSRRNWLIVALCMLAPALAYAGVVVIWDEAVDGDLSNDFTVPTTVTPMADMNTVQGTIGGPAPLNPPPEFANDAANGPLPEGFDDGVDSYEFTILPGASLDQVLVTNYAPTPGNTTSGWNLYANFCEADFTNVVCSVAVDTAAIGQDLLTICASGAQGPGTYCVRMLEFGTADNVYSFNHVISGPVPVNLEHFSVD